MGVQESRYDSIIAFNTNLEQLFYLIEGNFRLVNPLNSYLDKLFRLLDNDGSGKLSLNEISVFLIKSNVVNEYQMADYFYMIDLNDDGEIDLLEFKKLFYLISTNNKTSRAESSKQFKTGEQIDKLVSEVNIREFL